MKRTALVLVMATIFDLAQASTEQPYEIQQPVYTHDAGIEICPVVFALRGDVGASPGCLLERTFAENRHFLEIDIRGSEALAEFEGVFPLSSRDDD